MVHSAHDDPDSQTQARFRMIGATVAGFPVSGGSIPLIRALVKRLPELKRGYDPTDVLLALSPDLAAMERHLARVLRAAVKPDMVYLEWQMALEASRLGLDMVALAHGEGV